MTLRTLIFWPHLIAGVIAGSIILLMSVTGVVLTYERQLIAWSDSGFRSNPAPGASRLSPESLLAKLRQDHPEVEASAVTFAADPTAPVAIAAGRESLYADAYTGALVGESTQGMRRFMSATRAWHRWIAVEGEGRPLARAITGWSNFFFLFIVASGFYLWFPRKWTWPHLRTVTLFSGRLRGKARDFNWHNVIGFWSAVPLFVVVLTAMPISFPWANALVYRAVGEEPPQQGGRGGGGGREGGAAANAPGREGGAAREGGGRAAAGDGGERAGGGERREPAAGEGRERRAGEPSLAGLDGLWTVAERQVPGWRTINMRIPASDRAPVVFAIDKGDGGQPQHRSTLTLDRASAAIVSYEAFADQSLGRRLRSISRFAHTGEVLGIPGQTVAGLVTAGAVVMVWTGIALTLRRFRAWIGRRARRSAEETDEARDAPAA
jgi:uncharacterized iron-regulated membrane protein